MWQADKVKIQNELSDNIAKIMNIFVNSSDDVFFEWIKGAFSILVKEWNKIDYYRINKFMYLVNQLIIESLNILKEKKWAYKVKFIIFS